MDWIGVGFWVIGTLLVVVTPMILLHELGHFIPAKLAGVRVEEFGIGYPPRMVKLWRDKGYLEIGGLRIVIPRNFRLPSGLIAGMWADVAAARLADGTYLLRHLRPLTDDGELTPARDLRDDGIELRGRLSAFEPGTLYSLNWLPLGGFTKMTGEEDPTDPRSLAAQPKRWRVAVLAGGAALNILTAFVVLTVAYSSGYPEAWLAQITSVDAGGAAEEHGLLPGDVVAAVDGVRIVTGTVQLQQLIQAAPGRPVEMTILRKGERLTLTAVPRPYYPEVEAGATAQPYGLLGIRISSIPDRAEIRYYSLPAAFRVGCADIGETLAMMLRLPALLARGDVKAEEVRPVGIVGISSMLTFSLQRSIAWRLPFPALRDAAFVSLALGLSNLLPIPFLDGGRLLIVLIEAIRRRRMSPEREAAFHFAGLVFLLGVLVLIIFQDIVNPIIPWAWLK